MVDVHTVQALISSCEGKEKRLYSDSGNPYESIEITARVSDGMLTVTDSECEHGPDGGWSCRTLTFDRVNTQRLSLLLAGVHPDPFRALSSMIDCAERTDRLLRQCRSSDIQYRDDLSI